MALGNSTVGGGALGTWDNLFLYFSRFFPPLCSGMF